MNLWEALELADTAYTVGMLALTIGCPVAGVTAIATKILIKQATKFAVKKCIAAGSVAGVTATACAFFAMGDGQQGNGGSAQQSAPPGIPQEMLDAEVMELLIEAGVDGRDRVRLGNEVISEQQLVKELLPYVCYGKLQRIEYRIELPDKEHGEWKLLMKEVESSLENMKSSFEVVESTAKGQQ
jgi:hypothetical protein